MNKSETENFKSSLIANSQKSQASLYGLPKDILIMIAKQCVDNREDQSYFKELGVFRALSRHFYQKVTPSWDAFVCRKNTCVSMSASTNHVLLLTKAGEVFGRGSNESGKLGLGEIELQEAWVKLNIPAKICAVSTSDQHSLALSDNGEVWGCGWNKCGQLGLEDFLDQRAWVKLPFFQNVSAISAGYDRSFVSWKCGAKSLGIKSWEKPYDEVKVQSIDSNGNFVMLENGTALQVFLGEEGSNQIVQINFPGKIFKIVSITIELNMPTRYLILSDEGEVWSGTRIDKVYTWVQQKLPEKICAIEAGDCHILALSDKGEVWGSGSNFFGQLTSDVGSEEYIENWVKIYDKEKVFSIVASQKNSFLIFENGNILGCGANSLFIFGADKEIKQESWVQVSFNPFYANTNFENVDNMFGKRTAAIQSQNSADNKLNVPLIDDASNIAEDDLQRLMEIGFCYVKLPQSNEYETSFEAVYQRGLGFFRQSNVDKMKFAFDQSKVAGYSDRRDGAKSQRLEHFFCRPSNPLGPLADSDLKNNIEELNFVFHEKIAKPILIQILTNLGLEQHYHYISDDYFSSISFSYYPEDSEGHYSSDVSAHKDFELITVLAINKPGLQVWYKNNWHEVLPKEGCVVVNLANTLALITSGKCHSALHRVIIPEKNQDRMSLGIFVGLSMEKPVVDLFTQKELYPTAQDCIKAQLSQHRWDDLEEVDRSEHKSTL